MACKVTKYGAPKEGRAMVYEFAIDSSNDVAELEEMSQVIGIAPGSSALDTATGDIYVYSSSHTWELTFPV